MLLLLLLPYILTFVFGGWTLSLSLSSLSKAIIIRYCYIHFHFTFFCFIFVVKCVRTHIFHSHISWQNQAKEGASEQMRSTKKKKHFFFYSFLQSLRADSHQRNDCFLLFLRWFLVRQFRRENTIQHKIPKWICIARVRHNRIRRHRFSCRLCVPFFTSRTCDKSTSIHFSCLYVVW